MALQDIKSKFYNVALTAALLAPGGVAAQDTHSIPTMTAEQAKALSRQPKNCNQQEAIFKPVVWYNDSEMSENYAKMLVSSQKEEEDVDVIPVKGNTGAAKAYLCGYETKTVSKHLGQTPVFEAAAQGAGSLTALVNYYTGKESMRPILYRVNINSIKEHFPKFPTKVFESKLPTLALYDNQPS